VDKLLRLTAEQRDNLTAYLDGELADDAVREIETVLVQSPIARNDVELLAKTYDLLELLPRPKASGDFTERTIATARLDRVPRDYRQTAWYKWSAYGAPRVGWLLGLCAASAVGYLGALQLAPRADDELLDELPLIQRLHEFEEAGDFEFLDRLGRDGQLLETMQQEIRSAGQ
jgi:anti-sigma factor RsiW